MIWLEAGTDRRRKIYIVYTIKSSVKCLIFLTTKTFTTKYYPKIKITIMMISTTPVHVESARIKEAYFLQLRWANK